MFYMFHKIFHMVGEHPIMPKSRFQDTNNILATLGPASAAGANPLDKSPDSVYFSMHNHRLLPRNPTLRRAPPFMKQLLFGIFHDRLSYPASMLTALTRKLGWEAHIVFFAGRDTPGEIAASIAEVAPDLIALSIKTLERKKAIEVARVAREMGIPVIAGGAHATGAPHDLLATGLFAAVVTGDGAGVLHELLDGYSALRGTLVPGRPHPDPAVYSDLHLSREQEEIIRRTGRLEVLTTVGCPFNCHFCATTRKIIPLPTHNVVDRIVDAQERLGINLIRFLDDTFVYNRRRLLEFRDAFRERGIQLQLNLQARVNVFTEEIADILVEMGVDDITFGVESASQRLLDFINKKIKVEEIHRARRICRERGIAFRANLMAAFPGNTAEDYDHTLRFLEEARPESLSVFYFIPFPGTWLFDYCIEHHHMPEGWSFDDYLGIDTNQHDIMAIPSPTGLLRNVDAAMDYVGYRRLVEWDHEHNFLPLLERAEGVDGDRPWLLLGTGTFFYRVVEAVNRRTWRRYLGFLDIDQEGCTRQPEAVQRFARRWEEVREQVAAVLVTVHDGVYYQRMIAPKIREELAFTGDVVHLATVARPNR